MLPGTGGGGIQREWFPGEKSPPSGLGLTPPGKDLFFRERRSGTATTSAFDHEKLAKEQAGAFNHDPEIIEYSCVADEAAFILNPPLQRQRRKLTSVSGDPGKNQTLHATFDFSTHKFRPVNKSSRAGTRWRTDEVPRT